MELNVPTKNTKITLAVEQDKVITTTAITTTTQPGYRTTCATYDLADPKSIPTLITDLETTIKEHYAT